MYRIERTLFYLLILLLPTQLGKHFWPDFTIVSGIRIDYLSPTFYLTDLLMILLFGFIIYRWFNKKLNSKFKVQNAKLQFKSKKLLTLLIILLFFIVNILLSSRLLLSFYGLVKLAEFVFLGLYTAKTIRYEKQLQRIALLFAISSLFESLLAIAQYLHQGSLNGIFYYFGERAFTGMTPGIANASIGGVLVLRPYGTFPHPNVLAGYLLISMVLIWSFLLQTKQVWMRILASLSLLVSSIALLLTFSRVAILLWIIMIFFVLAQILTTKLKTIRARVIMAIVILISIVIVGTLPVTHEVVTRFTHTTLSDESVTERTELLSTALIMIRQHPLFGVGLYNFIPAMAPLQKPLPLGMYLQPVHNIFMLAAAETGGIGLGLFVWLLAETVKRIRNYELRIRNTFFVLIAIILITGMFDHYWLTLQQGQLLFAVVLGLCWIKIKRTL